MPGRHEGSQRHRGPSARLAWDSRYPPVRFYCPRHMKETQDPCGERQRHRWSAQNELGRIFEPSAEQGLKPWSRSLLYQLTVCMPELRTLTIDTMSSCLYLQSLLSASASFSSSSHNSTAPWSEATRIPLSPIQVRLATLASVWTPAKQKPFLRVAQSGLEKSEGPVQQWPLRLEAWSRNIPSNGYSTASNTCSIGRHVMGKLPLLATGCGH